MKKLIHIIFIHLIFYCTAIAQNPCILVFRFEPTNLILESEWKNPRKVDSSIVEQTIQGVILSAYKQSYLLAYLKEKKGSNDTIYAEINLGQKQKLKHLCSGNLPAEWEGNFFNKIVSGNQKFIEPELLFKANQQILQIAENNGYPFAKISLDSIVLDSEGLSANFYLQKNSLFYFDSIDFGGNANITRKFLQQYCNIKPGSIYQENILKGIDSRLSELPYVQVVRPMGVYFYGNKAKPYVYLNQRKASSFDGVIGFAPQSSVTNKLLLTGDLNLKLVNLGGTGKNLELAYRGYLNNSQDLQIKLMWPYFLHTKLAIDYAFKLNKFDTTWFELFNDFGLQYRFSGNNYVKVYYQNQRINLFNADTQYVLINKKLPANHDLQNDLYGIGIRKSTLNYFLNPSKGYVLELDGGAGTKKIIRNSKISDLELVQNGNGYSIYDSVKMKSVQYRFNGNFSLFNKLASHVVLHTQLKAGIVANEKLFMNELFRIGGLKTLKGFDEQSIFASKFLICNIELKYLFQQNSGFLLFWNGAIYVNEVAVSSAIEKPWGVGGGLYLETGAGIFSLYYALGSQKGNSLEIQQAKIHFGLVNYF